MAATNWATASLGASIVSVSSELPGCAATNVLDPLTSRIWLSEDGIPQWICLSLQGLSVSPASVEIRTIGWHCWHAYSTNPRVVRLHVSNDGSKFRVWDTFTANRQEGGLQLFCCEPIAVELYPFIALEVVETFGGTQTYLNRLLCFSEEVNAGSGASEGDGSVFDSILSGDYSEKGKVHKTGAVEDWSLASGLTEETAHYGPRHVLHAMNKRQNHSSQSSFVNHFSTTEEHHSEFVTPNPSMSEPLNNTTHTNISQRSDTRSPGNLSPASAIPLVLKTASNTSQCVSGISSVNVVDTKDAAVDSDESVLSDDSLSLSASIGPEVKAMSHRLDQALGLDGVPLTPPRNSPTRSTLSVPPVHPVVISQTVSEASTLLTQAALRLSSQSLRSHPSTTVPLVTSLQESDWQYHSNSPGRHICESSSPNSSYTGNLRASQKSQGSTPRIDKEIITIGIPPELDDRLRILEDRFTELIAVIRPQLSQEVHESSSNLRSSLSSNNHHKLRETTTPQLSSIESSSKLQSPVKMATPLRNSRDSVPGRPMEEVYLLHPTTEYEAPLLRSVDDTPMQPQDWTENVHSHKAVAAVQTGASIDFGNLDTPFSGVGRKHSTHSVYGSPVNKVPVSLTPPVESDSDEDISSSDLSITALERHMLRASAATREASKFNPKMFHRSPIHPIPDKVVKTDQTTQVEQTLAMLLQDARIKARLSVGLPLENPPTTLSATPTSLLGSSSLSGSCLSAGTTHPLASNPSPSILPISAHKPISALSSNLLSHLSSGAKLCQVCSSLVKIPSPPTSHTHSCMVCQLGSERRRLEVVNLLKRLYDRVLQRTVKEAQLEALLRTDS